MVSQSRQHHRSSRFLFLKTVPVWTASVFYQHPRMFSLLARLYAIVSVILTDTPVRCKIISKWVNRCNCSLCLPILSFNRFSPFMDFKSFVSVWIYMAFPSLCFFLFYCILAICESAQGSPDFGRVIPNQGPVDIGF